MDILADPKAPNYRATLAYLRTLLPPLPDATPDAVAAYEREAMDAVAALIPYDAFEARVAARIVGMEAHAADSLRLAGLAADDPVERYRCRAQAVSMARQADTSLRTMKRLQAVRDRQLAEMHPAAMERAGYWFRDVSVPEAAAPPPEATEDSTKEQEDVAAEAERYAVIYPRRAALIRAQGGLPPRCDFGPPDPELVAAIVAGTSPALRALDASRPPAG